MSRSNRDAEFDQSRDFARVGGKPDQVFVDAFERLGFRGNRYFVACLVAEVSGFYGFFAHVFDGDGHFFFVENDIESSSLTGLEFAEIDVAQFVQNGHDIVRIGTDAEIFSGFGCVFLFDRTRNRM